MLTTHLAAKIFLLSNSHILTFPDFSSRGGDNGYSNGNGYTNGGSYGGGYGGGYGGRGGGGGGGGDRMSNLGSGLKKQDWGELIV